MGMKVKNYGAVVFPAKALTKESLNRAGENVVPIGQLWMMRLVPVADGKALPADGNRPRRFHSLFRQQGLCRRQNSKC